MSSALEVMEKRQGALLDALPAGVDRTRFWAIAHSVAKSKDVADCLPNTVIGAVFELAKLGLIPDKHTGHAYVLPYKDRRAGGKVAQVVIGYRGFIELARRGGMIGSIHTEIVYDGESFEYYVDERGPHIRHEPLLDSDRNITQAKYVYCVSQLSGCNVPQVRVVTRKEIMKVRPSDPSSYSPWKTDEASMWLKTAVRRASKLWPMTPDLGRAVRLDEQAEAQEPQDLATPPGGDDPPADPIGGKVDSLIPETQKLTDADIDAAMG